MDIDITGREYATKDISNMVGIAESTVRKYAQALEKAHYSFLRNENGFRIFTEKDIFLFREMKSLSKSKGMPIEQIAKVIMLDQKHTIRHEATSDTVEIIQSNQVKSNDIARYDSRYSELINKLDKLDMLDDIVKELNEQKTINEALFFELKQQKAHIENNLIERDKKLIDSLRLSLENKELQQQLEEIKATLLEVAASKEKKKPGLFASLFNKFKTD